MSEGGREGDRKRGNGEKPQQGEEKGQTSAKHFVTWCGSDCVAVFVSKISHSLTVLSHDPDASIASVGLNAKLETGPSWPASTSSSLPVCIDHTKISNESCVPAHTISPEWSRASEQNCWGLGVVRVLKFLYLVRSNALTEPSSDADTTALPFGVKTTALTGAVCSVKVMKQKPLVAFQAFTLPSSPPVQIREPFGE